ncbi:MAG: CPBP family intramembrane metalloprotease [Planctomycetaceae bacterium]|nr:CPBP family intramembrane metalloprotease [Planctomycetaceae bacterium]
MTSQNSESSPSAVGTSSRQVTPRWQRLVRLARKEVRESMRDRRTLATLVLMPLIVYPLLGLVVQRFAVSRVDPNAPEAVVVLDSAIHPDEAAVLFSVPDRRRTESAQQAGESNGSAESKDAEAKADADGKDSSAEASLQKLTEGLTPLAGNAPPKLHVEGLQFTREEVEALVQAGHADVGILQIPGEAPAENRPGRARTFRVICREGDPFSARAAEEVEAWITRYRDRVVRALLRRTPFGAETMPHIETMKMASRGPKESPLSAFIPLMLVLMTMTGAVYPAIDLTAGERERGTLEMLMAAPVARHDLLIGKFAAVFLVAVLTALINLTAMMLTLYSTGFDRVLLSDGLSIVTFFQVMLLLVVFASFFSAVLLSITSFARSFREAQAWLIPLMLVSLAPGILSLMPGVRLNLALAVVPLVNIVLVGKELFQGIASPLLFALTLLVTCGYTMAALRIAASIFGNDALLFTSGSLTSRRGETGTTDELPVSLAAKCGVLILPLLVVLSGLRHRIVSQENTAGQLILSAGILAGLFAGLPLLFLKRQRVRMTTAWALKPFSFLAVPGAILLGLSSWTIVYELLIVSQRASTWTEFLNNPAMKQIIERLMKEAPLALQLLTLALVPAIVEELFFRGFLMGSLLQRGKGRMVPLLVTTFVFAAAHVVTDPALSMARFPGTFLLGLILGVIRLQTGSIFPGMLMHFVNNAILLSLTSLQPLLLKAGINLNVEGESHLPPTLLVGAAVSAAVGIFLIQKSRRPV